MKLKTKLKAGFASLALLAMTQTGVAATVDDFKNSWEYRALELQQRIDMGEPLGKATFLTTHNSYNSDAYSNLGSYYDPNQKYSLVDQLDMGIRSLELDVHNYNGDLLLCHGQSSHTGCSTFDRRFEDGIKEVSTWLKQEKNRQQVTILYIEEHVDGRYNDLMGQIDAHMGELIYKPSSCQSLPMNISKADVLNAGKQVLIIGGNCGSTAWGQYAFNGTYPTDNGTINSYPTCTTSKYSTNYLINNLVRVYEDSTSLSDWFGSPPPAITPERMKLAVDCGMGVVGLDQLDINDSRLRAAVWSWGQDEPNDWGGNEDCATSRADGRFNDLNCGSVRQYACYSVSANQWGITSGSGTWSGGDNVCEQEFGSSYRYDVPKNGYQNRRLMDQKAAEGITGDVWLNYSDTANEGDWIPGDFPQITLPDTTQPIVYKKLRNDKGKCLDLEGRSTSNGTEIHQWSCHGADSQLWYQDETGRIHSKADSSKCVDVSGAGTGNGSRVVLWSCHGGDNQRWIRGSSNSFRPAHATNKALDIKDPFWGNGQRAHLWGFHGGKSQRWSWD